MTAPAAIGPHADAVVTLLKKALPTYDGEGPTVATRPKSGWAVAYFDPGTPEGTLGDRHRDLYVEFHVTYVGSTPEQCRWAVAKGRTALLGTVPAVSGRAVQPLWEVGRPPPMERDDSIQPPLFYLPVTYGLRSGPA